MVLPFTQLSRLDECLGCHVSYETLEKQGKELVATSCSHVFDKECLKRRGNLCHCGQKIEAYAPFAFINHAVYLDYDERCAGCSRTFGVLASENQTLVITNCGHIFDEVCVQRASCCHCNQPIIAYAKYADQVEANDCCPSCSTSFEHLRSFQKTFTIINCGHVYEQSCFTLLHLKGYDPDQKRSIIKCVVCGQRVLSNVDYRFPPHLTPLSTRSLRESFNSRNLSRISQSPRYSVSAPTNTLIRQPSMGSSLLPPLADSTSGVNELEEDDFTLI